MKKRFWQNAAILTGCTLLLNAVSMGVRVFQSALLGAEGIGLMQLTLSVYYVAVNFALGGLNLAVTRLVSEQVPARAVLRKCRRLAAVTGWSAGLGLFLLAPQIGVFLHDIRSVLMLRILAIGIPPCASASCCRGYYIAVRRTWTVGVGSIVEQTAVTAALFALLPAWAPAGAEKSCAAVAVASVVGDWVGYFWTALWIRHDLRQNKQIGSVSYRQIGAIAFPVALGYNLRSALVAVENALIPAGLHRCGQSEAESLASYGVVKGMVLPTLAFPSALLAPIAQLLVPEVAESRVRGDCADITQMADRAVKRCLIFAIGVAAVFAVFGDAIGQALYQNPEAGCLMRWLCPLIPVMYLDSIVDAMLKGMDEQLYSLKINLSDSAFRILWIVLFVPKWGVTGYCIAFAAGVLYNGTLSIRRLLTRSRLRISKRFLCTVTVCAFDAVLWSNALIRASGAVALCARIVLSVVFYGGFLILCEILPAKKPLCG